MTKTQINESTVELKAEEGCSFIDSRNMTTSKKILLSSLDSISNYKEVPDIFVLRAIEMMTSALSQNTETTQQTNTMASNGQVSD